MHSAPESAGGTMYLYIDEAGNLDFGEHGTHFFALTGVVMRRPFRHLSALLDAKYDALEAGLDLEYFHASEDRQAVRDQVLGCLEPHLGNLAAHAIVIDKRGLAPEMRCAERFYPAAFAKLVENAMAGEEGGAGPSRVIVVTDTLPVRRERASVTKAVKLALHERAKDAFEYRILHQPFSSGSSLPPSSQVSAVAESVAIRPLRAPCSGSK